MFPFLRNGACFPNEDMFMEHELLDQAVWLVDRLRRMCATLGDLIVSGNLNTHNFIVFYAWENKLLAAAGTQSRELGAFAELLRSDQLSPAFARHGKTAPELYKLLEKQAEKQAVRL